MLHSLFTDDDTNTLKSIHGVKAKSTQDELNTRLGLFLQHNSNRVVTNAIVHGPNATVRHTPPIQSGSSFASSNTSPVSTLTGSSEADVSRNIQDTNVYKNMGADSIGSLMSVSISGHSNSSMSPAISRRHSVTSE